MILNGLKSNIIPAKATQGKRIKILTPKQTLLGLPIAFAQVKAGNTFSKNTINST